MSANYPDSETIRAVLTLATRAPSVHNSQPWRWRVGPDRLHLYADPSRHLPSTDPNRRAMVVSCGTTLHHCTVALASCPLSEQLEIPLTSEAMRADVFGTSGYLQMLLSVGWAPVSTDPLPAAPRRPLSEVVDRPLDGVFTGAEVIA